MTASCARSATKETAPMISNELSRAAADVLAERRRQVEAEGRTRLDRKAGADVDGKG